MSDVERQRTDVINYIRNHKSTEAPSNEYDNSFAEWERSSKHWTYNTKADGI